jgi:hypothetical protein
MRTMKGFGTAVFLSLSVCFVSSRLLVRISLCFISAALDISSQTSVSTLQILF